VKDPEKAWDPVKSLSEGQEIDFRIDFSLCHDAQPSFNVAGSSNEEVLKFHLSKAAITASA
jgi:hypothetical protein